MINMISIFLTAFLLFIPSSYGRTFQIEVPVVMLNNEFIDSLSEDQKAYLTEQLGKTPATIDEDDYESYEFIDMDEEENLAAASDSVWTKPTRR